MMLGGQIKASVLGGPRRPRLSWLLCGFLAMALLSVAAHSQESFRTQTSLSTNSPRGTPGSTAAGKQSTKPEPPRRFAGWKMAVREGPDQVAYFRQMMKRRPSVFKIPISPMASTIHSAPLATGGASATNFPGLYVRPSLPAGALPTSIVTGDFNGDKKLDWVVANGGDNSLYLYLGNGDGTSQLPIIIPLNGLAPQALVAADVNSDGNLDIVVAEADSQTIGILLGNGDGTFQSEVELPALPSIPLSIAVADMNRDGHLDLVVGEVQGPAPGPLCILLGDGKGNFGSPIFAPNGNGLTDQNGFSVSIADVNADGIPDVLTAGEDASGGSAQIYIGKGDGTLKPGEVLVQGAGMADLFIDTAALADFNGDGCPDAAVTQNNSIVNVFPGDCKGNFDNQTNNQTYGMGDPAASLVLADVNGDGHLDLIVGGFPFQALGGAGSMVGNLLSVRFNDGTGHFGPLAVYAGDPGMFSIIAADLKGNGLPDTISANQNTNSSTVFSNDGAGHFGIPDGGYAGMHNGTSAGLGLPPDPAESEFVSADVNGDGRPDLVQVQFPPQFPQLGVPSSIAVLLNQGNGSFSAPVISDVFDSFDGIGDFVLADFRHTGQPDFLAEILNTHDGPQSVELAYARNTKNGTFGSPTFITFPVANSLAPGFGVLGVGDFNNDGKLDFAVASATGDTSSPEQLTIFLGNGDGTFRQVSQMNFAIPGNPSGFFGGALWIEDANGDGKPDIFLWAADAALLEFLGNGDGSFRPPTTILQNVTQMAMRDVNHDGLLDIIQFESGNPTGTQPLQISIHPGLSNGAFGSPIIYSTFPGNQEAYFAQRVLPTSAGPLGPVVGDFNGDGNLDLAIYQSGEGFPHFVQFMMGNGDGTFTLGADTFAIGEKDLPEVAAHDLLGDGRDILVHGGDFGATFLVLPEIPAPNFQVSTLVTPVLDSKDTLLITSNLPVVGDTTFQISSSDPAVQIPAAVTIPAGADSVEVPFTLSVGYNPQKVFSITVQSSGQSAVVYNFVPQTNHPSGFQPIFEMTPAIISLAPGQSSSGYNVGLAEVGDATASFNVLGCTGLPSTASCSFQSTSFRITDVLPRGTVGMSISTSPAIATGAYPFEVGFTNGVETLEVPGTLYIGDFTMSLSPGNLSVVSNGTADYTLAVDSLFHFGGQVALSCSGLPQGASCIQTSAFVGHSNLLQVFLNDVAPGNYTFTVTGTSASLTHSVTAQFQAVLEPVAALGPPTLSFGTMLVGTTSSPQPVTLTNQGSASLGITGISISENSSASGGFTQTNNCGSSLAPSTSCAINISASASSSGNFSGSLHVIDNASSSPQTVPLQASGVDFSLVAAPGTSTSATISAGRTAIYNLQLVPNQLQGTVQMSCSGTPAASTCSVSPAFITVTSGASVPFQFQVVTQARSTIVLDTRRDFMNRNDKLLTVLLFMALTALFSLIAARRRLPIRVGVLAVLATLAILDSCGGSGVTSGGQGGTGTPAGAYTLVVTGQYGNGTRAVNLSLTVQ
jgi:hypothetical protein